ncbi:MAG: PmoA family protein [Terracidiphilus sp.]|jgi:hypothetical protein
MNKLAVLAASLILAASAIAAPTKGVQVVADEANRRVDVTIDGQPFTSYIWPASLKKPVLYPLITDEGVTVTRGYPLNPRPGERVDHPHHAGLWFNYESVNGFDFWNNSDAIKPENRARMGTILHTKILSTKSGRNRGELVVESLWVTGANQQILTQSTRYIFLHRPGTRVIDMTITLKALEPVVFKDAKDGLLGMRVANWLESPNEKGGVYLDASGRPTKVESAPADAAVNPPTGIYLTSEGVKGDAAWGTRGHWCTLTGHTGSHTVAIAIFDQPTNPGYPTTWHARGYGLFAANPLGPSVFNRKLPALNLALEKNQTANFRYRVILFSHVVTAEEMNHEADAFAKVK